MNKEIRLRKIPSGTILALQELADRQGSSMEEALQHAINTETHIMNELEKGHTILSKDIDGKLRRLVFTHMRA